MKTFLHPKSGRVPPSETQTPSTQKQKSFRIPKENVNPNTMPPESYPLKSPFLHGKPLAVKNRSPLPPRPLHPSNPNGNPLKRKLSLETLPENGALAPMATDSGVQVVVRMRPSNKEEEEGDQIVQKISTNSISILDHNFTFDAVADTRATQADIFHVIGLPLVENCLAGFNSSIFTYGQTGGGKTYTMWGPPSAFSEDDMLRDERGLTPRVFERLFSRISEEQAKHSDKQLNYQCRCSFLEIYNEQITDLFDPIQRNLQIREDVRTGVYVDYLTEEYVFTMKDVTQLLIKGLANRRTGATSINTESSRSHCVFTCIVESRYKSMDDGSSILRTSRINLVDLAGSERQKLTGAAGERLKEAGNINRSLSQLGNLINILAEVSQSGKQRHMPYRDSKLTFLLQESLGGNAKLAMICAISPSQRCKCETFSTLRFAQRAKAIKNKAVVNEITQDDVNVLREQIRQLKEELLRMRSNASTESNGSYSTGWIARRSLNLLRLSLNQPTASPVVEDDSDEEMEIVEEVERPCVQASAQSAYCNLPVQFENLKEVRSCNSDNESGFGDLQPVRTSGFGCGSDQVKATDVIVEGCELKEMSPHELCHKSDVKKYVSADNDEKMSVLANNISLDDGHVERTTEKFLVLAENNLLTEGKSMEEKPSGCQDFIVGTYSADTSVSGQSYKSISSSLNYIPSSSFSSPTLSISSTAENYSRKSLRTSSSMSACQKNILENMKSGSEVLNLSFAGASNNITVNAPLIPTSMNSLAPTEHLATSLCRGLQVIEGHQQSSALRRSSFRFPIKPTDLKPLLPVDKVDVGVQTLSQELEIPEDSSMFICSYCKNQAPPLEYKDVNDDMDLQLVPIDGLQSADKFMKQIPKVIILYAVEKVLAGAIRREMALEDHCAKQAAKIVQLNRLVQQYKHERECNVIIEQTREDKVSRLEGLMDGILPTEEFMEEEFISLTNEHKFLKERYENHPEVLRVNIELKRVQDELNQYRNFVDMGERDVLMEEIQDLRSQLQFYLDSSPISTKKGSPFFHLTHTNEPISAPLSTVTKMDEEGADENFEQERHRWTETESKWISLSEELRLELEANRSLAEKWKLELDLEKKCTDELKEALQSAIQGHVRLLDQYAELQEKHIALLGRHRKIRDGISDVKRAAAKARVKGAESKFINSLAAEISAIKVEREKERHYFRGENKVLQAQLRDTAEAVQAAGELVVRMKEAEETAAIAQKRALAAEQESEKVYQEIDILKTRHEREIIRLNQFLAESCLPKEALRPAFRDANVAKYDGEESPTGQRWIEEFEPFGQEDKEFSRGTEPYSWFSGYDRCNV